MNDPVGKLDVTALPRHYAYACVIFDQLLHNARVRGAGEEEERPEGRWDMKVTADRGPCPTLGCV